MFKRPSSRRKSAPEQIELNLVPVLDTMVTLIGFMLFTTSFFALVNIESTFPQINPAEMKEKIPERPLQLTVSVREQDTEIWSPFDRIPAKSIPHVSANQPDVKSIHETLYEVKKKFPGETKVVLVPNGLVTYDVLIALMDAMRMVEPTDGPIYVKNTTTGMDEVTKNLFPEVVFGNLLGDS